MQVRLSAAYIAVLLALIAPSFAAATPQFAARSARTCDNCHLTPNRWVNPRVAERKCSMACQGCHVDPAGGGMRTVSGRFYGQSTLPMVATSPRPTSDWDRNFPFLGRRDRATTYNDNLPLGPNTFEESAAYADSVSDPWAWGTPWGEPGSSVPFQGRYGALNADPVLRIGADIRVASLLGSGALVFPMQMDFPVAVHPVHHVTFFVNTGARGRRSGYSDTFSQDHSFYFREAFVLLHEAPYQAYVKAGRFVPSYGLRLDDHTTSIRRTFELDGSLPESRVTGVEAGAAPNYPFINASWFRMASRARVPDSWDIFDVDNGYGGAVNAGWRDLGWTLGGSAVFRHRDVDQGGDGATYGGYGALNLWHYRRGLPLLYQAEYDFGNFQRASGLASTRAAFYEELDWMALNGITFLAVHDWFDPDREVIDDDAHRVALGMQVTPYPGVTVDGRVRVLAPASTGTDYDFFLQLHVWN